MPYECWAWVEDGIDGEPGIIAAQLPALPELGTTVLVTRKREIAWRVFGPIAVAHGRQSGNPVRLVHLVEVSE